MRVKVFRGDRLREIRERRELTQDELGAMTGISQVQLSRYELGKSEPSPDLIASISTVLNVTSDWLIGLVDEPNDHLTEDDLSPLERKLLFYFRRGDLNDLMRLIVNQDEPAKENG